MRGEFSYIFSDGIIFFPLPRIMVNTVKFLCSLLLHNKISFLLISSFQFSYSVMSDSVIPWTIACQASLSITNSQSLLKLMSIESVITSNHLILCRPFLLTSILPSNRIFANESVLHIRRPKYWSFSFSIGPSNEYSGLISFRMDWLISLQSKGLSRVKNKFFSAQLSS